MPRPKRKAVEAAAVAAKKARGETDLEWGLSWGQVGKPAQGLHPVLLLDSDTCPPVSKAAGFDIDFTVISTKSGRKFATGDSWKHYTYIYFNSIILQTCRYWLNNHWSTGAKDWQWLYPCVPEKLQELHKNGYRVLFFTNQAGIEKKKVTEREIMDKIEAIVNELQIPIFVCIDLLSGHILVYTCVSCIMHYLLLSTFFFQAFVSTGVTQWRKPGTLMWDHFRDVTNKKHKVKKWWWNCLSLSLPSTNDDIKCA